LTPADSVSPLDLLRTMRLIREAELRLAQLFADGEVPGFIHLSVGQEGVAAGVCAALEPTDTLASNHRGHGHALAKGLDLERFFLEIMGRADGMCKGRGGSMHVADAAVGMLGANGIVGAGLPIAVGSALAHQVRRNGAVAAVFFGDGALAEGVMHESFNLASVWRLPVLFICENNGWSEFSPTSRQLAADPCALALSHRIEARSIDGNDVLHVYGATRSLVTEIRAGGGPRFLECRTTRVRGHFEGDPQKYRDEADAARREDDPIYRLERQLASDGMPADRIAAVQADTVARVDAAVQRARTGAPPAFEAALRDVYAQAEAAP
jgi:TPP-dependent pyruvate/acetoin dehydrogenase alpha subunit